MTGHFHLELNEMIRDRGTSDLNPTWLPVFRGIGINIVYLGDFHDDSDIHDPGLKRFMEQKLYFEGARRLSDKNFLVIPAEEVNAYLGGHWYLMTPKPVYFSHAEPRPPAQQFEENDPTYGHVYHLGSSDDVLKMVNRESGIIWAAHPRTKSSAIYPDIYKDKDFFLSDRFIGASWESLPVDQSEKRLCEVRCFGINDDMSNWAPKPKFMLAEGDTYMKRPDDDTYSAAGRQLPEARQGPGIQRELGAGRRRNPEGQLLRNHRRDSLSQLGHRRLGHEEHLHRQYRVHLPAGLRRVGLERRIKGRPQDHRPNQHNSLRHKRLQNPLRRHRQKVGPLRRMGLRRKRRMAPTQIAKLEHRFHD